MKPNELLIEELRIGNYITSDNGHIYKVSADLFMNMYVNGWQESIPLTEQWLTELGFNENIGSWFIKNDEWGVFSNSTYGYSLTHSGYFIEPTLPLIKYVHRLQNLYFALTGEELIRQQNTNNNEQQETN